VARLHPAWRCRFLGPLGSASDGRDRRPTADAATALITGTIMVVLAMQVRTERRPTDRSSRQLFAFSILYLFLLFAVLLVERGWGGLIGRITA